MPTPTCSKCGRVIASDDINVAQDVAYCRACNLSHRLSDLTDEEPDAAVDLNRPPNGAWFTNDIGGPIIGAVHRNLLTAGGLLFATLFWNGIVSVFVTLAISATLHLCHISLPDRFPAPKMNGGEMGVGITVFLWLFLTPFITIGLFLAGSLVSNLFGRTEVRIANSQGTVFTGIGALGWKRAFDTTQVKTVRLHESRNNNGTASIKLNIELRDGKSIKFGSMLPDGRRQFMLAALRKTLTR